MSKGGFPFKQKRCVHCSRLALDVDRNSEPVCGGHLDYQVLFYRELVKITELVGSERRNGWIDKHWPGNDPKTPINNLQGYAKARILYRRLRRYFFFSTRPACTCLADLAVDPCVACIEFGYKKFPESEDKNAIQ